MEKIDKPKVFISYAWGNDDYKEKVLSFAKDLLACGIDVELDRWSLKEGFDSFAFMEQCVNDQTITNVIILLDPVYAKKANTRDGGVGTETQIISPEIYNNTKQEKFIPVVFERNENGEVSKPSFLKGLYHFDLTNEETFDSEFERLVKRLYGREAIKKPELGKKPAWVDQEPAVQTKIITTYETLKGNQPERVRQTRFLTYLREISSQIVEYFDDSKSDEDVIYHYKNMQAIRDQFLVLIKYYPYVENATISIPEFFEDTKAEIINRKCVLTDLKNLLLNELFIYTVAYYYKAKDYNALSKLFCKSYYVETYGEDAGKSFEVFRVNNVLFHNAVCKEDNKRYISGIASWWIEHINPNICSKKEFVFADILCFNASVLGERTEQFYWFPVSYIYDEEAHRSIRVLAQKLHSKENLDAISSLFGFADGEALKSKLKELQSQEKLSEIRKYYFQNVFDLAPFIGYYVKASDLGTKR